MAGDDNSPDEEPEDQEPEFTEEQQQALERIREEYIPPLDNYRYPRLADVHGDKDFKQDLELIVRSIEQPGFYEALGVKPERSFLFYGPPGTGKTFSMFAIRNELAARDKKVLYLPYDVGNYGTAYINMGAVNLQNFFNESRKAIRRSKYDVGLYWFDECDSIMGKRGSSHSHNEDDKLLECLMKNQQAISSHSRNDQYLFFATNFYEALDKAAIRAGRIDIQIEFKLPGDEARSEAFKYEILKANERAGFDLFVEADVNEYGDRSRGMSFSDISSIVQGAVRETARYIMLDPNVTSVFDMGDVHIYNDDILERIDTHRKQHHPTRNRIGFTK